MQTIWSTEPTAFHLQVPEIKHPLQAALRLTLLLTEHPQIPLLYNTGALQLQTMARPSLSLI
jgi:hypothetical protein